MRKLLWRQDMVAPPLYPRGITLAGSQNNFPHMKIRPLLPSSHYVLLSLFYFISMELWFALGKWPIILFFFILKYGAKQAWPTWNMSLSLVALFACVATVIGWRYYLYSPVGYMLAILYPIIGLTTFQSLVRYAHTLYETALLSLAVAFVLIEIIWILQFLPLHFVVETGFIVSLYYAALQIIGAAYEKRLSRKLLLELMLASALGVAILLSTARWI